jgi:hypothetical protein
MSKCSLCVYSSLIFLTNVFLALYYDHYLYAFLFLILTITSVIHHKQSAEFEKYKKCINIIDKIAVYCVIFYGGYIFYNKLKNTYIDYGYPINIKSIIIIVTFLAVVFLYGYGYLKNDYSFHPSPNVSQMYHGLLHLISSFGHHVIIIL